MGLVAPGTWDLPGLGNKLVSSALQRRFLITGAPEEPYLFKKLLVFIWLHWVLFAYMGSSAAAGESSLPDQGCDRSPQHWALESSSLDHQGSLYRSFLILALLSIKISKKLFLIAVHILP